MTTLHNEIVINAPNKVWLVWQNLGCVGDS